MKNTGRIFGIGLLGVMLILAFGMSAFAASSGSASSSATPAPPTFNVNTSLLLLCKGQSNLIPVIVTDTNWSTEMQNTELTMKTLPKNFYYLGNGTTLIGNITVKNGSRVGYLPVFVPANASAIATMQIGVHFDYLAVDSDNETRNLTFEVGACASPLSISVSPKDVAPDQIQNISIVLYNSGNLNSKNGVYPLKDLYVHYSVPSGDGLIVSNSSTEIGQINASQSRRINASVFVFGNITSESLPFNVNVTYYNYTNNLNQMAETFTLLAGGTIDLVPSSISVTPATVSPGGIFSISLTVTNTGTSGVSDANATALPVAGFKPYGASGVDFIGSISTQTPTPISIAMIANSSVKSGSYTIPIKISYLGNFRQIENTTVNVTVNVTKSSTSGAGQGSGTSPTNVTSSSGSSGSGGLIVGAVVFIIVLGVVYLIARGRRNKK